MKIIIVSFLFTCVVVTVSSSSFVHNFKEVKEHVVACIEETKTEVNPDDKLDKFDSKYACFNRCMLKMEGIINENDEVDMENLKDKRGLHKHENVEEVINKCMEDNKQDDKCMMINMAEKCVWEEMKKSKQ